VRGNFGFGFVAADLIGCPLCAFDGNVGNNAFRSGRRECLGYGLLATAASASTSTTTAASASALSVGSSWLA
jgi:hypothetical protein